MKISAKSNRTLPSMWTLLGICLFISCQSQPNSGRIVVEIDKAEVQHYLEEKLLEVWYPRIIDTVHGGYISDFEYDWMPSEQQSKFIVSQARGLWTAARAMAYNPDNEVYQQAAAHGLKYLKEVMWDKEYGGFHSYAPDFASEDQLAYKLAYGNAFGIYGLAQYAKVSGSEEAKELALQTFNWLEKASHDAEQKGYFNRITRAGISANSPNYSSELFGEAFWGNPAWKDQNSSIHLLEAFSTLYEVAPDSLVRVRLEEMFYQIRDQMIHEDGYLRLNFERDLTPVSFREKGREAVKENLRWDHVSFGHDIETAYLLLEAAHVLGMEADKRTHEVAKKLVDHSLATGFDRDFQGIFEGGYYFGENQAIEILNDGKTWWAQIEALNSLLLMTKLYPEEELYYHAFAKMWAYCKTNFIDAEHGGWYSQALDHEPETRTAKKATAWKTAYHTGRGLMNIVGMLEE